MCAACFRKDPDTEIDDIIPVESLPFVNWTRCQSTDCGSGFHEECKKKGTKCVRCGDGIVGEWYDDDDINED